MHTHQPSYSPEQSRSTAGFHSRLYFDSQKCSYNRSLESGLTHNFSNVIPDAGLMISWQVSPADTKCQLIQYDGCPACVFLGGKAVSTVLLRDTFHVEIGFAMEYGVVVVAEVLLPGEIGEDGFKETLLVVFVADNLVELLLLATAPMPTQYE